MIASSSHSPTPTILHLLSFLRHSPFTYLGLLVFSLCAFAVLSLSVLNVVNHHQTKHHTHATPLTPSPSPSPLAPSTPFEGVPPSSSFERIAAFPHDSSCQPLTLP